MTNSMNSPSGGPLNVWRTGQQQPAAVGSQQWRSPVPAAPHSAVPPEYRPALPERPGTSAVSSPRRRFVDRASFWYLLMFVALVLLLVSFWVWNRSTATQLGMSMATAFGWAS